MAGIITGSCHNRGKLVRFGYVNVMEQTSHFLAEKPVRAHEFHYYDSDNNGESCVAVKPVSGTSWTCIHEDDRNWWGYPHLYYPSIRHLWNTLYRQHAYITERGMQIT